METPDTGHVDAADTDGSWTLGADWVSTQIDQRHTMHAAGHTMST